MEPTLKIKQATKQGYIEIPLTGDIYIADVSYPTSKLRRGRAQGDPPGSISPTLTRGCEGGLFVFEEVMDEEMEQMNVGSSWEDYEDEDSEDVSEEFMMESESDDSKKDVPLTPEQEEMVKKLRIRKLTPEETFLLMGATIEDCEKCRAAGVSNSQLYKQSGNGLISNVVQYLMEHMYKAQYDPEYETTDERMVRVGYGV